MHVSLLRKLPKAEQEKLLASLSDEEVKALLYDWTFLARPEQLLPETDDWDIFATIAGRGWGKTRTGSEGVRELVKRGYRRIALVARTAADARDVMVEGESGILNVFPDSERPHYQPSKRRITFKNGAIAITYSADKPDQLRGPQHDAAWCDELAAWRYPETWDQLLFGLRLGQSPKIIVTTTPRATAFVRSVIEEDGVVLRTGHTLDNAANLAPRALKRLMDKYGGTRLGRQELGGLLLEDVPGALWTLALLDERRVDDAPAGYKRVVVAVDPAMTSTDESDETGIMVCGLGVDNHGYLIDDVSLSASPNEWAKRVVDTYQLYQADAVVAEVNNGGDLVETLIQSAAADLGTKVNVKQVRASRNKQTRAEPVAALYERGLVHHIGTFAEVEDQMANWVQGDPNSPDRMDAAVWGFTELMIGGSTEITSGGLPEALAGYRGQVAS